MEDTDCYTLTDSEKIAAFDTLAEQFYRHNFGSVPKASLDVLMFSFYIEHCFANSVPYDDYSLAKNLGVTESRIRNLKVKKELAFPRKNYDWREDFCKGIQNAKFDDKKGLVVMPVTDPNIHREVEAYIDRLGWYNEYQLNTKLLQMRPDQFITLCMQIAEEKGEFGMIDPRILANQLLDSSLSTSIKQEDFISKWKRGDRRGALADILRYASGPVLSAVISNLPFSGLWGDILKDFAQNLMSGS